MTTAAPAIRVRGLAKTYGASVAVADVGFDVHAGRVAALLGQNGAGKTTALRCLLGLVRPDAGAAEIEGAPYAALAAPARVVGAVLAGAGIHPGRTGRDHLRIAAAAGGVPAARVGRALEEVGLADAAGRRAGGYSLGMRQRLALAAALLGEPRILVLDEPANGLDPTGISWLRDRLRGFAEAGGTVLVSSHVLTEVALVADDVVVLDRGRVAAAGTLAEVTAETGGDLERAYLAIAGRPAGDGAGVWR